MKRYTEEQKELAREAAGKAIRDIFDIAEVLSEAKEILTADDEPSDEHTTVLVKKGTKRASRC